MDEGVFLPGRGARAVSAIQCACGLRRDRQHHRPAALRQQAVDQQFARWVMLHVQSNPLPICTRPRVLIKGKRT
jgi:hypothetical protein